MRTAVTEPVKRPERRADKREAAERREHPQNLATDARLTNTVREHNAEILETNDTNLDHAAAAFSRSTSKID